MIRLWISRDSAVSLREQLSAQILLGILSGQLAPGARLPSVRDLARRLSIHSNTVLSVYRDLAKRGWVETQTGSGVFVRSLQLPKPAGGLDELARGWLQEAQALGYSAQDLQAAIERIATPEPVRRFVAVDPDYEVARIIAHEAEAAAAQPVGAALPGADFPPGTCVLVHSGQAMHVTPFLGTTPFHIVHLKSMQAALEGQQRPPFPVLIGFVSRSPSLRSWAATLLSSLGFGSDSVLLRDPAEPGWQDGFAACHIIAADVVAAAELAPRFRPKVVRILTEASLDEIRALVTA
ncbi:MAG: GntR family transcriptional regulator [Bryobacteraceae bacterium]|nr:GntR family transcriptional regulator [Bryobacteraceae bacterium]